MNELQSKLFELLVDIDDICRRNKIVYYLAFGSALGAKRNEGFISWDDDADICMSRKEYKKFVAAVEAEKRDDRCIINYDKYEYYINSLPRYVDLTSSGFRTQLAFANAPLGVFIDIFIMDPMPREKEKIIEWKKLHYVYNELVNPKARIALRKRHRDMVDINLYNEYYDKVKRLGRIAVIKEIEEKLFTVDECDSDMYAIRMGTHGLYTYPISAFGEPKECNFEGHSFYIPQNVVVPITEYYGMNWRMIPIRKEQHKTKQLLNLAAGNIERECALFLNQESTIERFFKRKEKINVMADYYNSTFEDRSKPLQAFLSAKVSDAFEKYGEERLRSDYDLCMMVFGQYVAHQTSLDFYCNSIYIPLDDNYINILIKCLLVKGMVQKAVRIIEMKLKAEGKLNDIQQELFEECKKLLDIQILLDEENYFDAEVLLKEIESKYPDNILVMRGRIAIELNRDNWDMKCMEEYIEKALKLYQVDDELIKYHGDVFMKKGCYDEAMREYSKVVEHSKNGMLLHNLKKQGIDVRTAEKRLDCVL